ncbi:MAG: hypothetical protein LBR31_03840 [Desulfovibrio sp.]|nr:hypothetical protein [Desulfovibrio sp.]
MGSRHIASTPKSQVQSLSCQGTRVVEHYHQIRELTCARLDERHALLFAEPDGLRSGEVIDWYTPLPGPAAPVTELPEEEARELVGVAEQMAKDIQSLAGKLKADGSSQTNVLRGMTLELAICCPSPSCLYSVGGQPVMTCWGFSSSTPGAQPEELVRIGKHFPRHTAATPLPPTRNTGDGRSALAWLWLLPLLCALLLLLFVPLGPWRPLVDVFGLDSRPPAADNARSSETASLNAEEDRPGTGLSDPRLHPTDASETPEPPRQELVIPPKAVDYAFLEGKWMNDAGLVSRMDGRPITVIYAFDAAGNGTVTVRQNGKQDCVGKAGARFSGPGVLRIEAEKQTCPDENKSYRAETIECRQTGDGQTSCLGKSAEGADWGGNVYFKRVP